MKREPAKKILHGICGAILGSFLVLLLMDLFIANGGRVAVKTKTIYPKSRKWFTASAVLLITDGLLVLASCLINKLDIQGVTETRWLDILCKICASGWFIAISLLLLLAFLIIAFYYRKNENPKIITVNKNNPEFDARKLY